MENLKDKEHGGTRFPFMILSLVMILAGLTSGMMPSVAQNSKGNARADKHRQMMDDWKKDMAEFRARSEEHHELAALADSVAGVQAEAAVLNQDFVLEADQVTFRNGSTVFVNSSTTFISLKGSRAVVQISPSNFASGPNGVGGVTVDGMASGIQKKVGKKGNITISFNVTGIGINAQVEIYMYPGTNRASATIYPNFNSNTIWLQGEVVPYENSNVFEGNSL